MSPAFVESFGTTVGARASWFSHTFVHPRPFRQTSTRAKPGSVTAPPFGPNGSW